MGKNKHHYVPRFYLKGFASEPKRIHVFLIKDQRAIKSASLKGQCYKHKFYGKTDDLENVLAQMEERIAPIIKSLAETTAGTFELTPKEDEWLRIFIGLQITRTLNAADQVNDSTDKLFKLMFAKKAEDEGIDLSQFRVGFSNPVMHSMQKLRSRRGGLT